MSRKAVQANFEALFALEKPRQRYGVVRYGSGGGAAGGGAQRLPAAGEWTVVASATQAVDHTAISFGAARADAATPPRRVLLFQTAELDGSISPSRHDLRQGTLVPQPVLAARTATLREALETTGGNLDLAAQVLIGTHGGQPEAEAGVDGELLGGVGAVRVYEDPNQPVPGRGRATVSADGLVVVD